MFRQLIVVLLSFAIGGGCTMSRTEREIVSYKPQSKPAIRNIWFKGDYTLYKLNPTTLPAVVFRLPLEKPAEIGFIRDANGAVMAVAGSQRVPISNEPHVWKGTPAEGQIDGGKTIALVAVIVVVAGVVIYIAYEVATVEAVGALWAGG